MFDRDAKEKVIRCDGCDAHIRPHPEISQSGWVKMGVRLYGDVLEWYYCPDCWTDLVIERRR